MQKNLHMNIRSAVMHRLHVIAAPLVTAGLGLLLASCASNSGGSSYSMMTTPQSRIGASSESSYAPSSPASSGTTWNRPKSFGLADRPGLGTTLGSEYYDRSSSTQFYRRSPSTPDGMGSFHYNDSEGAKAMAELMGTSFKHRGSFKLAGGRVRASLETWGDGLPWYESGGKIFVIGEAGHNYSIVLENTTRERVEVVVSVDGLDVLSGSAASMSKRGYVIPKGGRVSIDGMKVGSSMRRFEFGSVKDSQAAKSGGEKGARNVGVIGVAVYVEDSAAAKLARIKEGLARDDARAFPGS